MTLRPTIAILAACGFAMLHTGCHHLHYHDRVWNGWCGEDAVCESAGGESCHQKGGCHGHQRVGWLTKLNNYTFCANGCGETYVGPWLNDPPDCCDPCDKYYGCFAGPNDCCDKKTFDPLLWALKRKHKHCAPVWAQRGVPTSGCHFLECPCVYGCHPEIRPSCFSKHAKGGCGKGCSCGKSGGDLPYYLPLPAETDMQPHPVQEIPTPVVERTPRNRLASHEEPIE